MDRHTNKDIAAVQFLKLVTDGNVEEAFSLYVASTGKHHNLYIAAGFDALKEGMQASESETPNEQFTIKYVITENDMVAVYSRLVMNPGETGMIVVHMFRFADDKIVEIWDCAQKIPNDSLNNDGSF
jgi:predicted SnoaL-like aldol condensation-catalyzing enzyme